MKVVRKLILVPYGFPVLPLGVEEAAKLGSQAMTCGQCGTSWDDSIATSYTPAPSGRCPFEQFHLYEESYEIESPEETALNDALINVARAAQELSDGVEGAPAKRGAPYDDGFTVKKADMESLREALDVWKSASNALLTSLNKKEEST